MLLRTSLYAQNTCMGNTQIELMNGCHESDSPPIPRPASVESETMSAAWKTMRVERKVVVKARKERSLGDMRPMPITQVGISITAAAINACDQPRWSQ